MNSIFTKLGITYREVGSLFLAISEVIFGLWFVINGLPLVIKGTATAYYRTEITLIIGVYLLILGIKTLVDFANSARVSDISHVMVWSFLTIISMFWGFNPAFLVLAFFAYLWYVLSAEA